jgi:hypothetical protein
LALKHNNRKEKLNPVVFKTAEQLLEEQENGAGLLEKPAADFGARIDTINDDICRSDYLRNV